MIHSSFGLLKFAELSSIEARRRFNGLWGSNTRPRVMMASLRGEAVNSDPLLYFESLDTFKYACNPDMASLIQKIEAKLGSQLTPGDCFWDFKMNKDHIFVKTKDSDAVAGLKSITVSGSGKMKATKFVDKILKGKLYTTDGRMALKLE